MVKRYYALLTGNPSQSEKPCFQNFDLTIFPDTPLENSDVSQRQLMQVFKQRCQEYAHNISINKGPLNLLLYGPTGLGKSYLLHCIAKEITDNSILALTFSANSLLNGIRQSYFNSLQDHEKQPYYDVPVLLIDDLGTEPMWEGITIEQLIVLLDYRINNKKYTVFSTNLTPQKILKKYSERIYSRLMDKKNTLALQFQGKDLRRLSRE